MRYELELLNQIHQNAEMGCTSIKEILPLSNNISFQKTLEKQLHQYEATYTLSDEILREKGVEPKSIPPVTKLSAKLSTKIQNSLDSSTAKLADRMIKGNTMGITNLTKELNRTAMLDHVDERITRLAKKQLKLEQHHIEELKPYL